MLAAYNGHSALIDLLITHGAVLNANRNGWTSLMYAAYAGQTTTVKQLLAYGEPVDARTSAGMTALMLASRQGHIEVVALLLRLGADPNLKSANGQSAMQMALGNGNTDIAELLLQAGAK
jgi:hypothetical protein